jgi:hypothetical protein
VRPARAVLAAAVAGISGGVGAAQAQGAMRRRVLRRTTGLCMMKLDILRKETEMAVMTKENQMQVGNRQTFIQILVLVLKETCISGLLGT